MSFAVLTAVDHHGVADDRGAVVPTRYWKVAQGVDGGPGELDCIEDVNERTTLSHLQGHVPGL